MAVGATIVIISGGIDLSVGSIYALAGVTMAMVLRGAGAAERLGDGAARARRSASASASPAGALNGVMVVGPARPPVHHHARDDVDPARHRVRHQQCREHPPAGVADARSPRRSLGLGAALYPGADAGDAGRDASLGAIYLQRTVDGPARVRGRRQRRGQPVLGAAPRAHPDRRLRAVGADRGARRVHGRELLRLGLVRRRDRLRALRHRLRRRRRREPVGRQGQRRSARCSAPLLIVLIRQSIRTLHFDQNYEWIIIGCAIIIAVVLDQASARFAARRLAGSRRPGRRPMSVTSRSDDPEDAPSAGIAGRGGARRRPQLPCGGSQRAGRQTTAPAARTATQDRDDRQELDQPGVPLGAHGRRGRGEGADREAQRADRDRLADAAARRTDRSRRSASRRPSTRARTRFSSPARTPAR